MIPQRRRRAKLPWNRAKVCGVPCYVFKNQKSASLYAVDCKYSCFVKQTRAFDVFEFKFTRRWKSDFLLAISIPKQLMVFQTSKTHFAKSSMLWGNFILDLTIVFLREQSRTVAEYLFLFQVADVCNHSLIFYHL